MLNFKHAHFVGIGGIGMSGIARILLQMGHSVSGSDLKSSRITQRLEDLGATIYCGHSADNVPEDTDILVVSSAVPASNPELLEAKRRNIQIIGRGHMLSMLMQSTKGIAVAGTHGKTTTTSMVATILEAANLHPTVVVGGELNDIGSNAKLGEGSFLVAEADESDASFIDLSPYIAVITSIDPDVNLSTEAYADCGYDHDKTGARVEELFLKFAHQVSENGFVVMCGDHPGVHSLIPRVKKRVVTYGLGEDNDIHADQISFADYASRCRVIWHGKELGELILRVPGLHNIQNALAAIAIGLEIGLNFADISRYMAAFRGVQRRFQILGEFDGVTIVDDYAHNPSKIKAAIKAAHTGEAKRVIVVFQPHRYTRTKFFKDEYCTIFGDADVLLVTDIYSAGEPPIEGVSSALLTEGIRKFGQPAQVFYTPTHADILEYVRTNCRAGDIVLFVGAGDINKCAARCAEFLTSQPSAC
ncbi:MAG: UDP-N-acetylmuramate--L-alanine ligase [bacterium]|nr:UDP-N-acetylmuramate--L-alanine ligase [bacterium]